jgi:protein-disulfide isomerase
MKLLRLLALSVPLLLAAGPLGAADMTPAPSAVDIDVVQKIVRDYLREHPEVIIDAIKQYQAKQDQAEAAKAQQNITALKDDIFKDPTSPVAGNPDGDVTVVEFFDYRCPYCKVVAPDIQKVMDADSKLRVVYKEFPILGPASTTASKAALASVAQGKYLPFHAKMIAYKGQLDDASIFAMAHDVGLDVAKLKVDMEKPEIRNIIDKNAQLADKLKIQGTPGFVIGDQLIPGVASVDDLTAAIKKARAGS